jgi:hypothetical protein
MEQCLKPVGIITKLLFVPKFGRTGDFFISSLIS